MLDLIVRWVLLAFSLIMITNLIPQIEIDNFSAAMFATAIIGLVNVFIRPIVWFLSLPINLLTLGLFTLVINGFMLQLASTLSPGFSIDGFGAAFLGSILLSFFSLLINWVSNRIQPA